MDNSAPPKITRQQILSTFIAAVIGVLVMIWVYHSIDQRSKSNHAASARKHYANVISDLERRWGREAFNLKIRIEAQRFLENPEGRKEQLLAYLTSQGGSVEFPSLQIEDSKGVRIASFSHAGTEQPKIRFSAGQEFAWAFDQENHKLFLVYRQLIWLGKENGYLLLYKPLDHALLTQFSYPDTHLTLWWNNYAVASSDGEDGLRGLNTRQDKTSNSVSLSSMGWPSTGGSSTPVLLIESSPPAIFSPFEFFSLVILPLLTFALGHWITYKRNEVI